MQTVTLTAEQHNAAKFLKDLIRSHEGHKDCKLYEELHEWLVSGKVEIVKLHIDKLEQLKDYYGNQIASNRNLPCVYDSLKGYVIQTEFILKRIFNKA